MWRTKNEKKREKLLEIMIDEHDGDGAVVVSVIDDDDDDEDM